MVFWVLWFIGVALTIVTRIAIYVLTEYDMNYGGYYVDSWSKSKLTQIIMNLCVIICIILVGGIANSMFLVAATGENEMWANILLAILSSSVTYIIVFVVLGLNHFSNTISHIIFIVVFCISIIGWTIPICNYNRNIERITETIITSTQERKLLYFCNIPVQEVSGYISGSSVLGNGGISGSISTSDELPYWYANERNEGKYDSVKASDSKIVFISDEVPYLEIISYRTYTKTINHNNGREDTRTDKEWQEYIFYLPEEIMQYQIN